MKKHFLAMISMLSVSLTAWATPCTTAFLDSYTASGFTCDVGNLQFSQFFANGSFFGSNQYRTANAPADIIITPVTIAGGGGFTLSNMNLSFTGGVSNTSGWLVFDALALSGLITDASVQMGDHSFIDNGYVQAGLGDYNGTIFSVNAGVDKNSATTSMSTNFPGVAGFKLYGSAAAGVSSYITGNPTANPGNAYIDGYTMLLTTSQGSQGSPTSVPEPGSALLMICGLLLLARRQWSVGQLWKL